MLGTKFGKLTIVEDLGLRFTSKNKRSTFVKCKCACGKTCEVRLTYLNIGKTKSCGCLRKESVSKRNKKDILGKRFGKLVVLNESGKTAFGSIKWKCKCDCGEICIVDGHSLRRGSTQSCGCKVFEKRKCGKEHHCYKHDILDQERIDRRNLIKVIEWRKKVYARDHHCCKSCGDSCGGNLNAHHLNSWNIFPNERFDVDNGITLCENCHNKFHKSYGYGNNTREQFKQFLLLG